MTPIKIAIVDDHDFLADALSAWLARKPGFSVVGRAEDGEAGLKLCLENKPDVALIDVKLPHLDGIELAEQLHLQLPELRSLIISAYNDPYTIWRVSQSGASGYLEKTAQSAELLEAIHCLMSGRKYFSALYQRIQTEWLNQPDAFDNLLSRREQDVIVRVIAGYPDEAIGKQLGIATTTVSVHRKNIRHKLRLHNDRDLIAYARQWGMDNAIDSI